MFSLICVWLNSWVSNPEAGDLKRYRAHYDVIVMTAGICILIVLKVLLWAVAVYIHYSCIRGHAHKHWLMSVFNNSTFFSGRNHMCEIVSYGNLWVCESAYQLVQPWLYFNGRKCHHGTLFVSGITWRHVWSIRRAGKLDIAFIHTFSLWMFPSTCPPMNFYHHGVKKYKPHISQNIYRHDCTSAICNFISMFLFRCYSAVSTACKRIHIRISYIYLYIYVCVCIA